MAGPDMIIARAVATACLTVLKWMLWLVAALLLLLIVAQYFRGEEVQVQAQLTGAAVAGGFGWLCGYLASRFARGG
jgi:hypothetical protein